VRDAEIIFVALNVLERNSFRLRGTVVLDLDFEVEWGNAVEGNRDDFFTIFFLGTVAICLSGLNKMRIGAWVAETLWNL